MMENTRSELIAIRIKEARLAARLTQANVAQLMQLSRVSITIIETGKRNVTADEILILADIFGVSPMFLLGQSPDMHPGATLEFAKSRISTAAQRSKRILLTSVHDQFPVFDYLVYIVLLRGEMYTTEIIEALSIMLMPTKLRGKNTIRSRLNFLAREGVLAGRQEASARRVYFRLTEKGIGRLHELRTLALFLSEASDSAVQN